MNLEDVRERVDKIRSMAGDSEAAHVEEDSLHRDVLKAIADGDPEATELARLALETTDLDFARWCA